MNTIRRLLAVAVAVALLGTCTACYQDPPTAIINPVDDPTTTTSTDAPVDSVTTTTSSPAEKDVPMTFDDLIDVRKSTIRWSTIETYQHTRTDNTAHFVVSGKNNQECTLDVTIDPESGLLTEATVTYGELSETILTDSIAGIMRILQAMSKAG